MFHRPVILRNGKLVQPTSIEEVMSLQLFMFSMRSMYSTQINQIIDAEGGLTEKEIFVQANKVMRKCTVDELIETYREPQIYAIQ